MAPSKLQLMQITSLKEKRLGTIIDVFDLFFSNNLLLTGSALAYYTMIAIGPVLLILLSFTSYVIGNETAHHQIFADLAHITTPDIAATAKDIIYSVKIRDQTPWDNVLILVGIILSATGVFSTLDSAFKKIWNANQLDNLIREYTLSRLRSFFILILIGVILLAMDMVNSIISIIVPYISLFLPNGTSKLVTPLNNLLFFAGSSILLAIIFKIFSPAKGQWIAFLVGGLITAFLLVLGKYFLTMYINSSKIISSYGAASSVISLMFWAYYSWLMILLGACTTRVISERLYD